MFEKWRLKEHMEIADSQGRHVGTVDSVDGDRIKLTRSDSGDGRHHYLDVDCVDRIAENRAWLKPDVPLPGVDAAETGVADRADREARHEAANRAAEAEAESYAGERLSSDAPAGRVDAPLFGTSGHGTGMGGSGTS